MGIKQMTQSKFYTPQFTAPNRWLITGGCGFIGTSLIKRLLSENPHNNIRVLDNLSVGSRDDLSAVCDFIEVAPLELLPKPSSENSQPTSVELIVGDIRNLELTRKVTKNMQIIVHLAANTGVGPSVKDPRADMEANVIGTFNMLEAARKNTIKKFIFASSGAPVGECDPPIHEEIAPHPVSPYGASKLAGEGYCSAFFRSFGIKTISLRFGNVYGPGSGHKNSVVAKFIKKAIEGQICEIYGDGKQTRDFIFIDDLVEAILKSSISEIGGETYQIATNREHTVNEISEILRDQLQQRGISMNIEHGQRRAGDVIRNFSDTSKAGKMLGWRAETAISEGVKQTIEWFLKKDRQNTDDIV